MAIEALQAASMLGDPTATIPSIHREWMTCGQGQNTGLTSSSGRWFCFSYAASLDYLFTFSL